jgi:hypothetical protein
MEGMSCISVNKWLNLEVAKELNGVYLPLHRQSGTSSKQVITFRSRSSSFDDGGRRWYRCFAFPQHCSMKLLSQWDFGEKWIGYPLLLQQVSSDDSSSTKSGSLNKICRQQQCIFPYACNAALFFVFFVTQLML